jgi:hypothetical protein
MIMETLAANLRRAFIDRETLSIGGGTFYPEDYKVAIPILKNHERNMGLLENALRALDEDDFPNLRDEIRLALNEG